MVVDRDEFSILYQQTLKFSNRFQSHFQSIYQKPTEKFMKKKIRMNCSFVVYLVVLVVKTSTF
jgi:hypothetical protein